MARKFKPDLESLGERVVPAAFSFRLADGTVGSGQFASPVLNPTEQYETFVLADLTVTYDGEEYVVAAGALADYVDGLLVGVTATATGAGPDVELTVGGVFVGAYTAPVSYDQNDTQVAFTLDDGTTGAMSYDLPWDSVDATLSSQTVSLAYFSLNIAGQNFPYGYGSGYYSYSAVPTARFEYGEFKGLNFNLNTIGVANFPYTSLAMVDLGVTAQAIGGLARQAQAQDTLPDAMFNLITAAGDTKTTAIAPGTVHVRLETRSGTVFNFNPGYGTGEVTIQDLLTRLQTNLTNAGWDVKALPSGTSLLISGKRDENGKLDPVKKAGLTYEAYMPATQPRISVTPGVTKQIYKDGSWQNGDWHKPAP